MLLVFGAKKLRTIGSDLGAAVRGFKKSVNDGESEDEDVAQADPFGCPGRRIRGQRQEAATTEKRDRNA